MRRRAEHRIGDTGPEKPLKLRIAAQFFDAEIERIEFVRIDQDRRNPRRVPALRLRSNPPGRRR